MHPIICFCRTGLYKQGVWATLKATATGRKKLTAPLKIDIIHWQIAALVHNSSAPYKMNTPVLRHRILDYDVQSAVSRNLAWILVIA